MVYSFFSKLTLVLEQGAVKRYNIVDCHQVTELGGFDSLKSTRVNSVACGAQHWMFLSGNSTFAISKVLKNMENCLCVEIMEMVFTGSIFLTKYQDN